jgi:hypothetical protein
LTTKLPLAERVLAVLAAICLVVAFAIGVLLPPMTPLSGVISMIDHDKLVALQNGVRATLTDWAWQNLFLPVLVRPAWFPPLGLGLVFVGAALTIASRRGGAAGSPRWRN